MVMSFHTQISSAYRKQKFGQLLSQYYFPTLELCINLIQFVQEESLNLSAFFFSFPVLKYQLCSAFQSYLAVQWCKILILFVLCRVLELQFSLLRIEKQSCKAYVDYCILWLKFSANDSIMMSFYDFPRQYLRL